MQEYRFKFYLNALHAIEINNVLGQMHPHTWEIAFDAYKHADSFIPFNAIEKAVEAYLSKYQDKVLNEVEPFNYINPTLENVSKYLKDKLELLLVENSWLLKRIEVSETPARSIIFEAEDFSLNPETARSADIRGYSNLSEKKADELYRKKRMMINPNN